MLNPSIFRVYDIRGIFPEEINEVSAYQIGRAFAVYLRETEASTPEKIIVGRDARLSSPILSRSFVSGFVDEGMGIWDIGLSTVDAVYFASGYFNMPAAMITASHNPKEWNGLKLMKKNAEVLGNGELLKIKAIADEKNRPKEEKAKGSIEKLDIAPDYLNHVFSFIDTNAVKPMNIAIDASNGATGPILKKIMEKLPIRYAALHFNPDGYFPHHEPDPTKEKNLKDLKKEILTHHYHFGCAFDGDGDRIIFVDEKGEAVNPSIVGAIMAEYFLKKNPFGKIIYSTVVSRIVSDVANFYSGTAIREKVGHQKIRERLKEVKGILGIETSGHYYFRDNFYADSGIISLLVMIAILSSQNKNLSALAGKFSKYASMPEINFKVENPDEFIKKIAQNFEGYDTDWLDGLTVRTDDFWLNIRPSNTEPLVRLNIEAKDEIILNRVKNDLLNLIDKVKKQFEVVHRGR